MSLRGLFRNWRRRRAWRRLSRENQMIVAVLDPAAVPEGELEVLH